jgi:PAS domain-containing protein
MFADLNSIFLNNTTKGICLIQLDGRVILINDVFSEMFKIPDIKMIDSKLYLFPHIPNSYRFEAYKFFSELKSAKSKKVYSAIRQRSDGMKMYSFIEALPIQVRKETFFVIKYTFDGIYQKETPAF